MQLNIREQEVLDLFGELDLLKTLVIPHLDSHYEEHVRSFLAALGTALDFRRMHPQPKMVPFKERPRCEETIFFLGKGFIAANYVCVGVHADGWILLFNSWIATQMPKFEVERHVRVIADFEKSPIPYVAIGKTLDRRAPQPLTGGEHLSGMDLFPVFLEYVIDRSR